MTTRQAAKKFATPIATGISALLLLGSAFASTEIQAPCPELSKHAEESLHAILDNADVTAPTIRMVDSSDEVAPAAVADTAGKPVAEEHEAAGDVDEAIIRGTTISDITTRLPGVSSNELPRFRRHMFRTDI